MPHSKRNRGCEIFFLISFIFLLGLIATVVLGGNWIVDRASERFGSVSEELSFFEQIKYSVNLYFSGNKLFNASDSTNKERYIFTIEDGESVFSIAKRLEEQGFIPNKELFNDLLVFSGFDKRIQSGSFEINHGMNSLEIAVKIQDPEQRMVRFVILPGWRYEEIAASLSTSGLKINEKEFINYVTRPPQSILIGELGGITNLEGFLCPGEYLLDRNISIDDLIKAFLERFHASVGPEMIEAFSSQGLNLYQAVILASIVEREAMVDDEKPMIASVFFNRLQIGMKLESDPTAQYAIGYDPESKSWWKSPLTYKDLAIDSPYNTYISGGLPPSPICNPGLTSLKAVAYPATTGFLFFRASCDNSGRHAFANTYEEHLLNECP